MHALTSLRRNAPSPPPITATATGTASAPPGASPRLPDPSAILAQLERAIAATEYSYASLQLSSLSLNSSRQQAVGPVQGAPPQRHGGSESAILSRLCQPEPGARANGESRSSDGAGKVGGQQRDDEEEQRPAGDEHGKVLVTDDSSILERQTRRPKPLRKASVPASADAGDVTGGDVEVIRRKRSSSETASSIGGSALPEADGAVVENGRILDEKTANYDASVADQAYRAGSSALAAKEASQALAHLRLALSKCPPDKPSALAKIQRLISVAQDQLGTQGGTDYGANFKKQMVPSSGIAGQVVRQGGGYPDKLPTKVLQVGDVEAADNAYRAGVSALEKGDPAKALEYLNKAARACPPDRLAAFAKIQLLMGQAHFELRLD